VKFAANMPRAVLDTSVLVSAFLSPDGTPAKVVAAATRSAFVLCLSNGILTEFVHALEKLGRRQRSFRYDDDLVARYVRDLTLLAERVERDLPDIRAVPDDPKDDMVVATAVAARADYLVTGDRRHLLSLREYEGIRIVTPRQFVDLIARSG
jgi:putative PIN family toxin of toxin-antitoxin system